METHTIHKGENIVSQQAERDTSSAISTNNAVSTTILLDMIRIRKLSLPQAALELGTTITDLKIRLRAELIQFRKGNSNV